MELGKLIKPLLEATDSKSITWIVSGDGWDAQTTFKGYNVYLVLHQPSFIKWLDGSKPLDERKDPSFIKLPSGVKVKPIALVISAGTVIYNMHAPSSNRAVDIVVVDIEHASLYAAGRSSPVENAESTLQPLILSIFKNGKTQNAMGKRLLEGNW